MNVSRRLSGLNGGGSDGWGVFYKARAMKAAGAPVVELTIGEHDIRTNPAILDEMHKAASAGHTGYAAIPGTADLRAAVAARVQARTGVPTGPQNVVITPGGQSALFAAHMAALDPGERAMFLDPYYATYPGTIRGAGGVAVPVPTRSEADFQPTRAALDAALGDTPARSLLINTPNNPTGVIYGPETLGIIAYFTRTNDMWLISDEVYDTQVWTGTHLSPRALPGMAERTLVVGSMSKSHAMTGSRVGWLVGPEDIIAHLINLSTHTTYGVPGFLQDAALWALRQGNAFEAEIAAPFQRRRDQTLAQIGSQDVVRALPSGGAMYLMLDIRATGLSGEAFADALLDAHHIATMPGESFGASAAGHIRLALTVDDAALRLAVDTLLQFAAELASEAA